MNSLTQQKSPSQKLKRKRSQISAERNKKHREIAIVKLAAPKEMFSWLIVSLLSLSSMNPNIPWISLYLPFPLPKLNSGVCH